jgi:multiple sugar transport system substrate-binding protein
VRNLLFILILVLIYNLSCSRRGDRVSGDISKPVVLKYWSSANPQEIELARRLVEKWNRIHPDIQVEFQPIPAGRSSEEVLLAAIAAGTTPDICSNIWPGAISEYIQAGGLIPLDQFPDFDSVISARAIPFDILNGFRSSDGHFYQFPWKTNPIMMLYNVDIFRDAGIHEPPGTYSEFYSAAERITRDIDGDGRVDIWMGYVDIRPIWWQRFFDFYTFYIAASGGGTLLRGGHVNFENEDAVKVFEFFQECFRRGYFPVTSFQGDPFLNGKLATRFTGPWTIAYIEANKVDDFEYNFAPVPVPDDFSGRVYTYGDHKNIAIFSTTKHREEAWEFVKFLVSEEADLMLLEICNQLPVRGDLLENPVFIDYFERNPMMRPFAEQVAYTRGVDESLEMKEIFDAISQEFEACAVYGARTPEEAVRNLAKRVRVILEWSR